MSVTDSTFLTTLGQRQPSGRPSRCVHASSTSINRFIFCINGRSSRFVHASSTSINRCIFCINGRPSRCLHAPISPEFRFRSLHLTLRARKDVKHIDWPGCYEELVFPKAQNLEPEPSNLNPKPQTLNRLDGPDATKSSFSRQSLRARRGNQRCARTTTCGPATSGRRPGLEIGHCFTLPRSRDHRSHCWARGTSRDIEAGRIRCTFEVIWVNELN